MIAKRKFYIIESGMNNKGKNKKNKRKLKISSICYCIDREKSKGFIEEKIKKKALSHPNLLSFLRPTR